MRHHLTPPQQHAHGWISEIYLPIFARCRDRWSRYGEQADRRTETEKLGLVKWFWSEGAPGSAGPPPELDDAGRTALETLLRNEATIFERVIGEILGSYRTYVRAEFARELGDPVLAQRIDSLEGICETIALMGVHLLASAKAEIRYLGLRFNATWADDHGVGVVLHGDRIVEVGSEDVVWCFTGEAPST